MFKFGFFNLPNANEILFLESKMTAFDNRNVIFMYLLKTLLKEEKIKIEIVNK